MRFLSVVAGGVAAFLLGSFLVAQPGGSVSPALLKATFGQLPLYFVENRGVYPGEVAFCIQGADKTLFFTKDGITFRLKGGEQDWVVKLEFVRSTPQARPEGLDKQEAVFSYFKGPPKDWKTGLRTYAKIVYRDLWPGIDLVYQARVGALKYEFVVTPGADPSKIRLRYRGVTSLSTTNTGALKVETPAGAIEDAPPQAWQEIDGQRVPVDMAYLAGAVDANGDCGVRFRIGAYDRTRPLVLDPVVLVYCGYIGGTAFDGAHAAAVDTRGNLFVTGRTASDLSSFPAKVGPSLWNHGGAYDVFVAKISADGTSLVYCGYIGGSKDDGAYSIAVDPFGCAYVAGGTNSAQGEFFPVCVGPDLTYNGNYDAFIAKVSATGSRLEYCGYLGGASSECGLGIAVDGTGRAFMTGYTNSDESTFPVSIGPHLVHAGGSDAFVASVDPSGQTFLYCGYVGGTKDDHGHEIAIDSAGCAYLAGSTYSPESSFPVKIGPDLTFNDTVYPDGFVAKVSAQGTGLEFCGYIGGKKWDISTSIAVDPSGYSFVAGSTESPETSFPVRVGPNLSFSGRSDGFVSKVDKTGKGLVYCGYIGGADLDGVAAIGLDSLGCVYLGGTTSSDETSFPVKHGPSLKGSGSFVAKVSSNGAGLVYSGFIDAIGVDGLAVDAAGNAYVAGLGGAGLPTHVGPILTYSGLTDAFVAKVALTLLETAGTPRPSGTVTLALNASDAASLPFQLGTSLGTGPIPIGTRKIDLSPDTVLAVSVSGLWPAIFSGYRGVIDSTGQAQAAINIPNVAALLGIRLHSAFVTLNPVAPSGIRSISNTETFTITK